MRLLGHPVHPMLVHFPIAFFSAGTVCDVLAWFGVPNAWGAAFSSLAIGVATAIPAAIAGVVDFARLEEKLLASATRHMFLMGAAWLVYLAAVLVRYSQMQLNPTPELAPILLSVGGLGLLLVGAYTGGELVYRFGAGTVPLKEN
jgi:uncharacterized membrane protein